MNLELVKKIADAVLYEGYILYPYRASTVKNQHRFNFGVLAPQAYHDEQAWTMRTECLVEGNEAAIDVRVRFLHLVSREVFQWLEPECGDRGSAAGRYELVPALEARGEVYHTWQEAVEREVVAENLSVPELVAGPQRIEFTFEGSETAETLHDAHGGTVGKLTRRQHAVQGNVTASAESQRDGLTRISVEIQNTTSVPELPDGNASYSSDRDRSISLPPPSGASRDGALVRSLVSTHTILGAHGGQFISLFDPPASSAEAAAACKNVGTWPVLVGNEGERSTILSSPIILYDYPQIAPESGGDFFDGTEIDEMLALRVLTLTDEEKREMRSVDDRARQILERTESMPPEHWQKQHGAIRGLKPNP